MARIAPLAFLALTACTAGGFTGIIEVCDNGVDDDGDGFADCEDASCAEEPNCVGALEICNNGLDDDGDGSIDCDDSDCARDELCITPGSEICDNGIDDDDDGRTDCEDFDCANDPACDATEPEDCDNGLDDDGDAAFDCDDSDCANDPACAQTSTEICDNGIDDDADQLVDCADSSCAGTNACLQNASLLPCDAFDSWTVSAAGPVTVTVDTTSAATTFDPVLFDWDGDRDTWEGRFVGDDEVACTHAPSSGTCPQADLEAGSYELVVLGYAESSCADVSQGGYSISVVGPGSLSPGALSDNRFEECDNNIDDDGDGATDCDDVECDGDLACGPGGVTSATGTIEPCTSDGLAYADSWVLTVPSGTSTVTVDTTSAGTSFDPVMLQMTAIGSGVIDDLATTGDDDFACTFPPPDYSCPSTDYTAGTYEIVVFAGQADDQCASDPTAGYVIEVTGGGTLTPGIWDDVQLP